MENISISTILGGGAILVTIFTLFFKGKSFKGFKKIFKGNQNNLKKKINDLEVKEAAKIIAVKEAEEKIKIIKKEVNAFVVSAKKEIKDTGEITNSEKLLEEFNKW